MTKPQLHFNRIKCVVTCKHRKYKQRIRKNGWVEYYIENRTQLNYNLVFRPSYKDEYLIKIRKLTKSDTALNLCYLGKLCEKFEFHKTEILRRTTICTFLERTLTFIKMHYVLHYWGPELGT